MATGRNSFRIGRVQGYLRGRIWYLYYFEQGLRRRPRVGPDRDAAKQLAAQTNAQLETGAPSVLSFEPVSVLDLQRRWLEHHEHIRRSSIHTIRRYQAATNHLLAFIRDINPVKHASAFHARDAEEFVRHLREIEVAPNGHAHAQKRQLRDKGIVYILNCCRTLFMYAAKRRHLSPYAENPFSAIEISRIPIEDAKPVVLLDAPQEQALLEACEPWQLPLFMTLVLTGLRPGELVHLLIEDLDLDSGLLKVRNKPKLGWQVKTRNERDIPLLSEHVALFQRLVGGRKAGPVFLRERVFQGKAPAPLSGQSQAQLQEELARRVQQEREQTGQAVPRTQFLSLAKSLWWEAGAVKEDRVRTEFIRLCRQIGMPSLTMPKVLRHMFATALQDANVDPLIRNQLMGHMPASGRAAGGELGMTAVYTHSRPETVRRQLAMALATRPAVRVLQAYLQQMASTAMTCGHVQAPIENGVLIPAAAP